MRSLIRNLENKANCTRRFVPREVRFRTLDRQRDNRIHLPTTRKAKMVSGRDASGTQMASTVNIKTSPTVPQQQTSDRGAGLLLFSMQQCHNQREQLPSSERVTDNSEVIRFASLRYRGEPFVCRVTFPIGRRGIELLTDCRMLRQAPGFPENASSVCEVWVKQGQAQ